MKSLIIGAVLLLSGAMIASAALIATSIYSLSLGGVEGRGWNGDYGIFGTALLKVGTFPLIVSVVLAIAGIVYIVNQDKNE